MNIHYLESLDSFMVQNQNKRILVVGAGNNAIQFMSYYEWNIWNLVDNDTNKQGQIISGKYSAGRVISWDKLLEYINQDGDSFDVIVVTPDCFSDLLVRLENALSTREHDIYLYSYMYSLQWDYNRNLCSRKEFVFSKNEEMVIPKRIHCFWFSGEPLSESAQKCYDSWKKHCPDYEITIWNKNNYQTDNVFCNEALNSRQWAFASDYARCDVVYRFGGIYLDLDVELIKSLDDMLYDDGFFCFESAEGGVDPGSGFAAISGNEIIRQIREKYENIHFLNEDGSFNRISILNQYTDVLKKYGLVQNGEYQMIDKMAVYPPDVMSPYSYRTGLLSKGENTHGIHHWVSAWISDEQRYYLEKKKIFMREHEEEVRNIINCER